MLRTMAIAFGGAAGALLRYWVSGAVYEWLGKDFPYGTLCVNVLGSFFMGFLYVLLLERMDVNPEWRAVLMIGLLGAFTTFSTFSLETLNLIEAGEQIKAGLNVLLSVCVCVSVCWAGMILGRQL